jgi:hypothetical protein
MKKDMPLRFPGWNMSGNACDCCMWASRVPGGNSSCHGIPAGRVRSSLAYRWLLCNPGGNKPTDLDHCAIANNREQEYNSHEIHSRQILKGVQMKKIIFFVFVLVLLFGLIQLVPYGRDHTNPPITSEPAWDSPATRTLAKTACFDCHSNESVWPQYASIAPISWLIYRDVMVGRSRLNFSEWNTQQRGAGEIAEVIQGGEMPPLIYLPMHPKARLTSAQKQQLIIGLQNSLK